MKYNISNYRLKGIVEELGEEYKDLLIEHILDDMQEVDADLINPSDLIRLDITIKSKLRVDKKMQKKNRMLSMISMLGIIYAMLGLILMMMREMRSTIQYDSTIMMSMILMIIGLFVTLFSLLLINMQKTQSQYRRGNRCDISSYEIVNKWKEIEALVNELTPEKNKMSLFSMIKNLEETNIISEKDVEEIKQLLKLRNQIVHEQNFENNLSEKELRDIILRSDKIIYKMKKIK